MLAAFDMEMIFHSHANETHFHKEDCALGLILKVRVFGTRKWPIIDSNKKSCCKCTLFLLRVHKMALMLVNK